MTRPTDAPFDDRDKDEDDVDDEHEEADEEGDEDADAESDDDPFAATSGLRAAWVCPDVEASCVVDASVAVGCVVVGRDLAARLAVNATGTAWVNERVGAVTPPTLSDEERLLRSIFGEAAERAVEVIGVGPVRRRTPLIKTPGDGEVWFTDADVGEVTAVSTVPAKRGVLRHLVELRWQNPVQVGDVIVDGDDRHVVVSAIDNDAGIARCAVALRGPLRVERPTARERLVSRSIGPYSEVTRRPTGEAVIVSPEAARALRVHAPAAADELVWRSDDDEGHSRLYESIVMGRDPRDASHTMPAPTRAVRTLDALLATLGFGVDVNERGLTLVFTGLGTSDVAEREAAAPPPPPAPDGAPKDIFSFFEKPKADVGHRARRGPTTASWSFGEVKKPETLNYRTLKPERDGLFCERIFGPSNDYECLCGKYKRIKHRGIVCERCGVEVIQSRVRAERFGHVVLARAVTPVHLRPLLAQRLGISRKELDARITTSFDDGNAALVESIAAVVDPPETAIPTRALLWTVVPVLPPRLRPLVALPGGRFATSDLNDLYRRVINRNNRLKRLIELNAPAIILNNEHRELSAAVDALLNNRGNKKKISGPNRRPLVDVASLLSMPLHRHRKVDYAAEFVVVVDASVEGNDVAVSRAGLAEVLKPFTYRLLEERGVTTTIKGSKKLVEEGHADARAALDAVAAGLPVWLNAGVAVVGARIAAIDDESAALRMSPSLASSLSLSSGARVALHVPLSDAARAELAALPLTHAADARPQSSGWVSAVARCAVDDDGDLAGVLIGAVGRSDDDSDDARGLLVRHRG